MRIIWFGIAETHNLALKCKTFQEQCTYTIKKPQNPVYYSSKRLEDEF